MARSASAKSFVLDSWPLLETLRRGRDLPILRQLLEDAVFGSARLLMSEVNLGEVFYTLAADRGASAAERLVDQLNHMPIEIIPPLHGDGLAAGRLKARWKVSLADCFCLMVAQRYGATIITGDEDFRRPGMASEYTVLWLGA